MKLRSKLLIGGLSSTMMPILIIGLISVYRSFDSISSMAEKHLSTVSQNIAGDIRLGLSNELRLVESISFFDSVVDVTEEAAAHGGQASKERIGRVQDEFRKIKESSGPRYSGILLVDYRGIVFADSSGGRFADSTFMTGIICSLPSGERRISAAWCNHGARARLF